MRALVAIVLSATAIIVGATAASAADLPYVSKRHHVHYAPEPCSPCDMGWPALPPVAYVGYRVGRGPCGARCHYRHQRWAGGCHIGPAPCHHHGWHHRWHRPIVTGHVLPGRYQLVQQKEYLHEPVLVVVNRNYAHEPGCGTARCRW